MALTPSPSSNLIGGPPAAASSKVQFMRRGGVITPYYYACKVVGGPTSHTSAPTNLDFSGTSAQHYETSIQRP